MLSRKLATLAIAGLLALVVSLPVSAQVSASTTLKADIPFEFIAADKTLPAGEYTLQLGSPNRSAVAILSENRDSHAQLFALTSSVDKGKTPDHTSLIFHKYGDRYFLAQIWTNGVRTGLQLPASKLERELTKTASNFQSVAVVAQLLPRR
jgi:hypothetical protein